ncbi:SAM-dependent methyltransferase [Tumebacillus avium]|uniref:SAM-dependent methyltransferase n=1 Tax=Tumebacillus avium TaxID=1903704 RepID=A0A1Y0ITX3_9BACL|nr:methyltransferase domain-containing protein [Tumebacillus avium]ARU63780.1 SAM-dependent methyltransferase [Tumebacillus avium]
MNPWNERFLSEEYVYGTEANAFLKTMAHRLHQNGRTLAIAEGEGRNATYLAQQGMDVTTWDYAEAGLDKTRRLAAERGVQIRTELVDLNEANWGHNQWDQIICIFGHFNSQLREQTLAAVRDAVRPGGYFLSEVYSVYQPPYGSGGPKDQDQLYRPEEFLQTFAGWKIIHLFMGEVERYEGNLHNGLSHVVQILAQKSSGKS